MTPSRLLMPLLALCLFSIAPASAKLLFDGSDRQAFQPFPADGVQQTLAIETDANGNRELRIDFNFAAGAGYAISRMTFDQPLELPEHFVLSFDIRGDSPLNTLEVKLIDPSMENVWWVNRRDFSFPQQTETLRLKRRHFVFAWGPAGGEKIHEALGALEIVVTASQGGAGSVWIDNVRLEPTAPPATGPIEVALRSTSASGSAFRMMTAIADTQAIGLSTTPGDVHTIDIDLGEPREFSGLLIGWNDRFPTAYRLDSSRDGQHWHTLTQPKAGNGGIDAMLAPEHEARYLRLTTTQTANAKGLDLRSLSFIPIESIDPANDLLMAYAQQQPRGHWPMVFEQRQVFWNVIGNPASSYESLISEHGVLELSKGGFTVEPFLRVNDDLLTWAEARHEQFLERGDLPISRVLRQHDNIDLEVLPLAETLASGAEVVITRYMLRNTSDTPIDAELALAVRPIQVLPPWQRLNLVGGYTPIHAIAVVDNHTALRVNDETIVRMIETPDETAAGDFSMGEVAEWIAAGQLPGTKVAHDEQGLASGVFTITCTLQPGEAASVHLVTPLGAPETMPEAAAVQQALNERNFEQRLTDRADAWDRQLGKDFFHVDHASARNMLRSLRAQVGYILINMDGVRIQPGSRTYERSWIRDGALTGKALVNLGQAEAVQRYFDWYAPYQYDNGKVPCVVDHRGPDPVDEHDSTGQLIYLARLLLDHTHNEAKAREHYETIRKGVVYMEDLRNQRLTDEYVGTAYEGLVPESISHEGYSEKPMHAYWDNTFVVRGFMDAAAIAARLGHEEDAAHFAWLTAEHRDAMMRSIEMAAAEQNVNFIPGCVELGDFDPPSTAVAVSIGGLVHHLSKELMDATFERYWQDFALRTSDDRNWFDYTPYELRVMATMIRLGHRQRAHAMYDWLAQDQHPSGWLHWAEIAYRDDRTPRFIGDMPHTWVGAGFVNAVRGMFVWEDEERGELLLGLGIKTEWLDGRGVRVVDAPTRYGPMSYQLYRRGEHLYLSASGEAFPPNGFRLILPDFNGTGEEMEITFDQVPYEALIPIGNTVP
ncbi:discoidin domain-containing protein [Mucisphaera sp.]|uniref:discoidin domain-containing protein n=1 Tax=Mucisphaera sp. TaxID=2913024 RepID=UPI003D0BD1EF